MHLISAHINPSSKNKPHCEVKCWFDSRERSGATRLRPTALFVHFLSLAKTVILPSWTNQCRWSAVSPSFALWFLQIYRKEAYSKFPPDLASLANDIISCVLGRNKMVAEAAIVNYYHQDSCLSGHTDHSEFDLQAPLVSIRWLKTLFSWGFIRLKVKD